MIDWLITSIDPLRPHLIDFWVAWHARLMVIVWCFIFPLGIFAARFFKITPQQNFPKKLDNQTWWWTHLICQYGGCLVMLISLAIIWQKIPIFKTFNHHQFWGLSIVILCALQVLSGLLRGTKGGPSEILAIGSIHGDHYDMTGRRILFEIFHKSVGYVMIFIAMGAIISGLLYVNAPRWMWLLIYAWWIFLFTLFYYLQHKKMCVDTYQAIWGTDPNLPGNKIKPIGFGISRIDHKKP